MYFITSIVVSSFTLQNLVYGAFILPRTDTTMRLVWRHEDLTDNGGPVVAIAVYKAHMSAQLTQNQLCTPYEASKTYTIKTDNFANSPLTIEVDEDQGFSGQINFAGKTYSLSNEAASNSSTSCYRLYNDNSVFIDCTIPISSAAISKTFPINNDIDCLTSKSDNSTFSLASSPLIRYDNGKAAPDQAQNNTLVARKVSSQGCTSYSTTQLSGDGNPHQNAWDSQLSETITCGQTAGCSVGSSNSKAYTVAFSATAKLAEWISGGFSVSQSWTTGNSYTCNGAAGDTVCIWYNTMHTAYTVHNYFTMLGSFGCNNFPVTGPDFVLKSPNNNNAGGGYYCVVGTCRNQGDSYWE